MLYLTLNASLSRRSVLRGGFWLRDCLRAHLRGVRSVASPGRADERRHRSGLLRPCSGVRGQVVLGNDGYEHTQHSCHTWGHSVAGWSRHYKSPKCFVKEELRIWQTISDTCRNIYISHTLKLESNSKTENQNSEKKAKRSDNFLWSDAEYHK